MIGEGAVIGLAIIAFGFAYLSTSLGKEHAGLQIGYNIIFVLVSTADIFLALAYTDEATYETAHGVLSNFSAAFVWILILVVAYFMIWLFVKTFDLFDFNFRK